MLSSNKSLLSRGCRCHGLERMKVVCVKLSNGVLMPCVSLGTYKIEDEQTDDAVYAALEAGYRGLDCAQVYGNEEAIGRALKKAIEKLASETVNDNKNKDNEKEKEIAGSMKLPTERFSIQDWKAFSLNTKDKREGQADGDGVFVTSKIWPRKFDRVAQEVEDHLKRIQRPCVDLYIMHWPGVHESFGEGETGKAEARACMLDGAKNAETRLAVWHDLERLQKSGKCRAIGVSNFMVKHLRPLLEDVRARQAKGDANACVPAVNQIEFSPYLDVDPELRELCEKNGIQLVSYSTLASRKACKELLAEPAVLEAAKRHSVDATAVVLRYALQSNFLILPKSGSPDHIRSNFENLFSFHLDDKEYQAIAQLSAKNKRQCPNPHLIE